MSEKARVPIHVEDEPVEQKPSASRSEPSAGGREAEADLEMWRDRAQRLQAEMENFRKRQRRVAEERILEERERLLQAFLDVVDNLERALLADEAGADRLKHGVSVTHQAAMQLLEREGVQPIAAQGRPFDPAWHEAMGAVPAGDEVEPGIVVEVIRRGYRLGDRLLRPARVIVAA